MSISLRSRMNLELIDFLALDSTRESLGTLLVDRGDIHATLRDLVLDQPCPCHTGDDAAGHYILLWEDLYVARLTLPQLLQDLDHMIMPSKLPFSTR